MMLFEASPYRTKIVVPGVHLVESNHFERVRMMILDSFQHLPPDAAKSIDTYFNCHF